MEMMSTITCPACGHREAEIMPEDACQYFYKCKGCGAVLKPKEGIAAFSARMAMSKCPSAQAECGMLRKG